MKKMSLWFSVLMVLGLSSVNGQEAKPGKRVYSKIAIAAMVVNETLFDVVLPVATYFSFAKGDSARERRVLALDGLLASYIVYCLGGIAKEKVQCIVDKFTDIVSESEASKN